MEYAIELTDIHKSYKDALAPALDGFSLRVANNRIMGLLGPNGAGKTTCLSILCGLLRADRGTALVAGMDCSRDITAIRAMTGVVPQQIALFGDLTAVENFRYIGRLYGLEPGTTERRMWQMLEQLGLDKHADKRINNYSGGMKRRANMIASLLHDPALLILDEPTAGVDVQSRTMILNFLRAYQQQGNTILYTSHLLDEAEQICDEVVIIDEGKYVTGGTPQELISNTVNCKRLEDVFLHYTGKYARD